MYISTHTRTPGVCVCVIRVRLVYSLLSSYGLTQITGCQIPRLTLSLRTESYTCDVCVARRRKRGLIRCPGKFQEQCRSMLVFWCLLMCVHSTLSRNSNTMSLKRPKMISFLILIHSHPARFPLDLSMSIPPSICPLPISASYPRLYPKIESNSVSESIRFLPSFSSLQSTP